MIQRCFQRVKSGLLKNKFAAVVTIMHTALQKKKIIIIIPISTKQLPVVTDYVKFLGIAERFQRAHYLQERKFHFSRARILTRTSLRTAAL